MGDSRPRVDPEERVRALKLAYACVNRRERTTAELCAHLTARGVDADPAGAAIEALKDQGYLDDARFARVFAEDKRHLDQWGSDRIRRALLERGLDPDLVEATLTEAPEDELERARAVLRRRFPSPPLALRDRDRALRILLRKGFDSDLAYEALAGHAGEAPP